MIVLIQAVVVFAAILLTLFALAGRQTHAAKAWKKLALCLLAVAMVVAVLFPDTTNIAAHIVGVGRGADLLLYVLTLAFVGYAINNYLHRQRDREVVHKLARKVALYEAKGQAHLKKNK